MRRVREVVGHDRPLVVVVTGHYLHDGLRHRMAAAGADFYFLRSDLRSADLLGDVVLHPNDIVVACQPVADADGPQGIGVGPSSDVEA